MTTPSIITYKNLRRALGIIGVSLPIMLLISENLFHGANEIRFSISQYYHSASRDLFVSVLSCLGIFLLCYGGYDWKDRLVSALAGLFAFGVAFCPADYNVWNSALGELQREVTVVGTIHNVSAALLFVTFAIFALFLFRIGDNQLTPQKKIRNRVYLISGMGIVVGLLLTIFTLFYLYETNLDFVANNHLIFWLETKCLFWFGLSWLTKSEFLFPDVEGVKL